MNHQRISHLLSESNHGSFAFMAQNWSRNWLPKGKTKKSWRNQWISHQKKDGIWNEVVGASGSGGHLMEHLELTYWRGASLYLMLEWTVLIGWDTRRALNRWCMCWCWSFWHSLSMLIVSSIHCIVFFCDYVWIYTCVFSRVYVSESCRASRVMFCSIMKPSPQTHLSGLLYLYP